MTRRTRLAAPPRLEFLEARLVLSAIAPSGLDSAYGLNSVAFSNGTIPGDGRGQTIAIVDAYHDPTIWTDLFAFDARYNIVNPNLAWGLPSKLNADGGPPTMTMYNFAGSATDPGWNAEEALDLETAHAAAPEANIVVIEARSSGLIDLLEATLAAETLPSVSVISMSWGGPEFPGIQQFDGVFTTPAGHAGITFLASSGDDGGQVEWPSSSPNVVGVGGTSLIEAANGSRSSETAWGGSGGGTSQVESKPAFQASAVPGAMRSSPDVASDADPATGGYFVSKGGLSAVGGTSMAAPLWAGLIAIADEGRAVSGLAILDGPTQTLPDLYAAPSAAFDDITSGPRAAVGYDTATGLGSPNAPTLISFLDQDAKSSPKNPSPPKPVQAATAGSLASANNAPHIIVTASTETPSTAPSAGATLVPNLESVPSTPLVLDPGAIDEALEAIAPIGRLLKPSKLAGLARG